MGASRKIAAGLYLRTDFWAPITSGGSYGHTCYVAKELAAITGRFVCLLAQQQCDCGLAHTLRFDPHLIVRPCALAEPDAERLKIIHR